MKGLTTMAKNFKSTYNGINRKSRNRDVDLDLRILSGSNVRDINMDEYDELEDYEPIVHGSTRFQLHEDD